MRDRFGKKTVHGQLSISTLVFKAQAAAENNDLAGVGRQTKLSDEAETIEPGHLVIRDDDVKGVDVGDDHSQGLHAVAGKLNRMTAIGENVRKNFLHVNVVLSRKDAQRLARVTWLGRSHLTSDF